jgi:predicted DNA-binding transcriptional regulator AlpA
MDMTEQYLKTKEVASLLKCSTVQVQRYVKRGHFPGTYQLDPTMKTSPFLIPLSAVEQFQKSRIITPEKVLSEI